jgi:hypothetical protein
MKVFYCNFASGDEELEKDYRTDSKLITSNILEFGSCC